MEELNDFSLYRHVHCLNDKFNNTNIITVWYYNGYHSSPPLKELITKHVNSVLRYTRTLRTTDDTWNGPFDDFPELVKICCLCLFLRGSLYIRVWVQWWNYVPLGRIIVNKCINPLLHLVCVLINNNNNLCVKLFIFFSSQRG